MHAFSPLKKHYMITHSYIKKVLSGKIAEGGLLSKPFIVMRSLTKELLTGTATWEYHFINDNRIIHPGTPREAIYGDVLISRKTAMNLIRHFNMIEALTTNQGQIYELPGEPFKTTYKRAKAFKKMKRRPKDLLPNQKTLMA